MRSVTPMKAAKTGYITISAIICLLGLTLIIHPGFSARAVGTICGICLIIFGGIKIIGYFSKDLFRLAFQFDLATGILLIILGVVIAARPDDLMTLLCVILGISTLTESLFKIQTAIDSKRFGIKRWWLIMAAAIVSGIFGAILVTRPAESAAILVSLLGISLLCEGILNLITVLTAVKIIKNQQPDVIEITASEITDRKD